MVVVSPSLDAVAVGVGVGDAQDAVDGVGAAPLVVGQGGVGGVGGMGGVAQGGGRVRDDGHGHGRAAGRTARRVAGRTAATVVVVGSVVVIVVGSLLLRGLLLVVDVLRLLRRLVPDDPAIIGHIEMSIGNERREWSVHSMEI